MRIVRNLVGSFLLIRAIASISLAQAQDAASKWNVIVECKMIVLPQSAAFPLLSQFLDPAKANEAVTQLEQMIAAGKATLTDDLYLRGVEGAQLSTETTEEIHYPAEYEPAQIPQRILRTNQPEIINSWPVIGNTPTAYEIRSIGPTFKSEVHVSGNGTWLDVYLEANHSRFAGWREIEGGEYPDGRRFGVQRPTFDVNADRYGLRLRNGGAMLIGAHKLPGEKDRFELFILHATARPVDSRWAQ